MTLDAACRRSKIDSTHDIPATLERHGRSFRHISPWLTVEEFTREGARLFRRRVTGQASRPPSRHPSRQESFRVDTCARRRGDGRLDQSRFVCLMADWLRKKELERMWKESVLIYINVITHQFRSGYEYRGHFPWA
jgi:hypothetical protein